MVRVRLIGETEEIKEADSVEISENGELVVFATDEVAAMYAPGVWRSARVEQPPAEPELSN